MKSPAGGRLYYAYLIALLVFFAGGWSLSAADIKDTLTSIPFGFWVLAALAVIADTPIFTLLRPGQPAAVSASVSFTFTISYAWGHGLGRLTQTLAILVASAFTRRNRWLIVFDVGRYGLALWASGLVAASGGRALPVQSNVSSLGLVLAAAATWYAVFRVTTATEAWLREGGSWLRPLVTNMRPEALTAGALLVLSPMLIAILDTNAWLIPLVLVPLYAVSTMTKLLYEQSERYLHDPLTGLPNRTAMERAIERAAAAAPPGAAGPRSAFALMVVDLDRFQLINDALGYEVADQVLIAAGSRLAEQAGAGPMVARLKGDEFGVLLPGTGDEHGALARASAIRAHVAEPIMVAGQPLTVDTSIGIAFFPQHGTTFNALVRHADMALHHAKQLPGGLAIYRPEAETSGSQQLSLLRELRRVTEEPDSTQLVPYYQPQIELATGDVVGVEALLRFRHPTRGMLGAEEVIRVAEHSPVMQQITMRMIELALRQLSRWRSAGLTLRASVNVSVRDLYASDLVAWLRERLHHHGLAPGDLQLEITESAFMAQPTSVLSCLQALRTLGVGAALDDFGTGFSSLQHLRRLPLTEVKVDRSFTQSMVRDAGAAAIVRSIVGLGNDLGLRVVAEGVEDEQTRQRLLAVNCSVAQGWYYAKAMPVEEFDRWFADYRASQRKPTPTR